jgi:hypothetical protein
VRRTDCYFLGFLRLNAGMPTVWLGYSWAMGILYLSTAHRILYYFLPYTAWGARVVLVRPLSLAPGARLTRAPRRSRRR